MNLFRRRRPLPFQWRACEPDHEVRAKHAADRVCLGTTGTFTYDAAHLEIPMGSYAVQAQAAGDRIRADVDHMILGNIQPVGEPDMIILDDNLDVAIDHIAPPVPHPVGGN